MRLFDAIARRYSLPPPNSRPKRDLLLSPALWWIVIITAGVVDLWGRRYELNPDGISYLEMARHALAGQADGLINGYWSPGYPLLLMPGVALFRQDWPVAVPAAHVVNFLLYLFAAWLFLRLMRLVTSSDSGLGLGRFGVPLGATAFAAIAIRCIGLGLVTPDFVVVVSAVAAAYATIQLERSPHSWRWAAGLGAILGAAYWGKGIMFPVGAGLLLLLFVLPPAVPQRRAKVALASAIFAIVSLPLIVLVSRRVGHPSIGEVGRLNYIWEVDGVTPYAGWLGDSTGRFGTPTQPPRLLQGKPQTLEFATPIHATYPLWFDPSHWYAGVRARFDPALQWQALRQGLDEIRWAIEGSAVLIISLLALWLFTAAPPAQSPRSMLPLALMLWAVGASLLYALVHAESRYLAPFFAVAVAAFSALLARRIARRLLPQAVAAAVVAILVALAVRISETTGGFQASYRPDYLIGAAALRGGGLRPGDRVAMVGDAFEAYAAFAADLPVTVQVLDSAEFWQMPRGDREALQGRIAATGVKAILANNVDPAFAAEGWQLVPLADSATLGIRRLPP